MSIDGIDNRELLDYDKIIIDTVMKLEDRATQFCMQNYAASGVVFLAFFTTRIPMWIATLVLVILWCNFTTATTNCFRRIRLLLSIHDIARSCWLEGQSKSELRSKLEGNVRIKTYLDGKRPSLELKDVPLLPVSANIIPLVAAIVLQIAPESWYSPRPAVSVQSVNPPVSTQSPAVK